MYYICIVVVKVCGPPANFWAKTCSILYRGFDPEYDNNKESITVYDIIKYRLSFYY